MLELLKKLMGAPKLPHPRCTAILVAAGTATRMEGEDKVLLPLGGIPVIVHSLSAFEQSPEIDEIIIVTREDLLIEVSRLCKEYSLTKVSKILVGGEERSHSVLIGINEVSRDTSLIAIHDGARPFLTQSVLHETLKQGARTHAAVPAIPMVDTVKQATETTVELTLDRSTLWAVQTPQVFDADLIRGALTQAVTDQIPITDDCSAVERIGCPVTLVAGDPRNRKITTPLDLVLAESIYQHYSEDFA
ncbi:MAG: 2-C-methyl-D-erythritol 4-phosphate cytidylyltransferase [Eubacteriales bacterium]